MYKRGLWPVILLAVLWCSGAGAKRKRAELPKQPRYDVHQMDQMLPRDKQVSTFLYKGYAKTYFYWSDYNDVSTSVTITPCMATLRWSIRYRHKNDTSPARPNEPVLIEVTTGEMRTYNIKPQRGLFVVQVEALESDSYGHIYVSTEPGGPQALQVGNLIPRMRFLNRQNRKKLTLRWNQSMVDPHVTEYCLVVSTKRNYSTLCEALEKKFGVYYPPEDNNLYLSKPISKILQRRNDSYEEPIITCLGKHTHHTFTNLRNGEYYYFNLFASNQQNNLTYLYGSERRLFSIHRKPAALRDGIPLSVNLRKDDGKSVFRYKVGRNTKEPLRVLIMPCGGAVDVEITLKGKRIQPRQKVNGYGTLIVKKPTIGQRYYIRIFSTNREELKRTSSVKVLATTKSEGKFPLPMMPSEPQVFEYKSLRKCNSTTVAWQLSPDRRAANYCLVVKEGRIREMEGYRMPNQCGLENRLRKSADIIYNHCRLYVNQGKKKVVTQEINHLKPDRSYIVQVVIKSEKPGSRTLSYDLLQVQTNPCEPL